MKNKDKKWGQWATPRVMIAVGLGLIISPVYRSVLALDFTTFLSIQAQLSLNEAPSLIPRTGPGLAPIISPKKLYTNVTRDSWTMLYMV